MNSRTIARLPRWSFVLGSLLLTLLFVGLALNDYQARDRVWQQEIESQGRLQAQVVQRAQYGVERSAKLLASTLATDARVLELMRAADRALRAGASLDDSALSAVREQLAIVLSPAWEVLQREHGRQLQIYWGGAGIALLRMHDPEAYGDAVADLRPLLHATQVWASMSGRMGSATAPSNRYAPATTRTVRSSAPSRWASTCCPSCRSSPNSWLPGSR